MVVKRGGRVNWKSNDPPIGVTTVVGVLVAGFWETVAPLSSPDPCDCMLAASKLDDDAAADGAMVTPPSGLRDDGGALCCRGVVVGLIFKFHTPREGPSRESVGVRVYSHACSLKRRGRWMINKEHSVRSRSIVRHLDCRRSVFHNDTCTASLLSAGLEKPTCALTHFQRRSHIRYWFRRGKRPEIQPMRRTQCTFSRGFVFIKKERTNTRRTTSSTRCTTHGDSRTRDTRKALCGKTEITRTEQRSRPRRNTRARLNTQPIVTVGCLRLAAAIPVALRTPRSRVFASLHVSTPMRGAFARVLVTHSRSNEWQWPP